MDYEKKYKEALGWMQSLYDGLHGATKEDAEHYFPELKESEDERIRKWLIEMVEEVRKANPTNAEHNGRCSKAIAWLEKQGEQKSIDNMTSQEAMDIAVAKCFNEDEQKPVDKAEPKFKVGDVMRTLKEATDNITSGLPVVVSIDNEYYHCNNELIAIKNQDNYEYPPINRRQNSAWGEEDETVLNNLIYALANDRIGNNRDEYVDWLKSLKPQNRWKPSDEQIKVCKEVYADILSAKGFDLGTVNNELNRLEEQLKKLKG